MTESAKEAPERTGEDAGCDPAEFSRKIRQLAIDANQILCYPDSPLEDVMGLQHRLGTLINEAPGVKSSEVHRYLLAVQAIVGDRLRCWAQGQESLVA